MQIKQLQFILVHTKISYLELYSQRIPISLAAVKLNWKILSALLIEPIQKVPFGNNHYLIKSKSGISPDWCRFGFQKCFGRRRWRCGVIKYLCRWRFVKCSETVTIWVVGFKPCSKYPSNSSVKIRYFHRT